MNLAESSAFQQAKPRDLAPYVWVEGTNKFRSRLSEGFFPGFFNHQDLNELEIVVGPAYLVTHGFGRGRSRRGLNVEHVFFAIQEVAHLILHIQCIFPLSRTVLFRRNYCTSASRSFWQAIKASEASPNPITKPLIAEKLNVRNAVLASSKV